MNSNIFSIEIFIDRIRLLEGERCLFPSTVLKLLNYEPTLISTIDYDVQVKLREYLDVFEKSTNIKKTRQINELKDADGNFIVRKGKSILFEGNTLTLLSEFNALPLYLLVCDDYFKPNHLVGVVAIKLSEMMLKLARKISEVNHTTSEDIMGKFPIVNLMGDGIGIITLKLRLIFIGANLAPHLPREQELVIKLKANNIDPVDKSIHCDSLKDEEKIITRNVACQVDKKRAIRIQVSPDSSEMQEKIENFAQVGLTIDPNDPILRELPPMIYNCQYDDSSSDPDQDESVNQISASEKSIPSRQWKKSEKSNDSLPILNALLKELKSWKSQENVNIVSGDISVSSQRSSRSKNRQVQFISRSKSEDTQTHLQVNINRDKSHKEFLKRMSQPKVRPESPIGIVPRDKGWLRKEPEYSGPSKSLLDYKLTKTQIKRIELRNPILYKKIVNQKPISSEKSKIICPFEPQLYSSDFSSQTHTPVPRAARNPLVPPLFAVGTSLSAHSYSISDSVESIKSMRVARGRPPQSPGKENHQFNNQNNVNKKINNPIKSFSYDTNETINEAEQYLNLNPVQSNRSPHMSIRSHAAPISNTEDEDRSNLDYSNDRFSDENQNNNHYQGVENGDEYSDGFNQSNSSRNENFRSPSRRHSYGSQISQTSEWRTDYSIESNVSHSNQAKIESSSSSLDSVPQNAKGRKTTQKRRSLLSNNVMPGGRFLDNTVSSSIKTTANIRPSFNESLEISNIDSSCLINSNRQSMEPLDNNPSMLRPGSAGADVTSFTKVTKYERSLVPGYLNTNFPAGTHLMTSTVGSLRTDDSQILTSASYY